MNSRNEPFLFSQAMIARLAATHPTTVFRVIKEAKIRNINLDTTKTKKYDLLATRKIISTIENHRLHPDRKIQVFYNLKGGTGKTSICYQIATHLAISGYKVLVIDCDSQGHLSTLFGFAEDGNYHTLYDVLINDLDMQETIVPIFEGLDVIPSNLSLSRVEVPLSQKARREDKLKDRLDAVKENYDYILIDTNPSISTLNLNALVCADQVNFVCETAPFSLYGLRLLLEEVKTLFNEMHKPLRYKIICNRYEAKTTTAQEVLGYLRSHYKENVYKSVVRKCEDINIASKEKLPISIFCKPKSIGLEDIIDLLHEFIQESYIIEPLLEKIVS